MGVGRRALPGVRGGWRGRAGPAAARRYRARPRRPRRTQRQGGREGACGLGLHASLHGHRSVAAAKPSPPRRATGPRAAAASGSA